MKRRFGTPCGVAGTLALALSGPAAQADFLIYPLGNFQIVLEGSTQSVARSVLYNHPNKKFDQLNFFMEDVTRIDVEDFRTEFNKELKRCRSKEDVDGAYRLVVQAIQRGWVGTDEKPGKFLEALDVVLELEPDHELGSALQARIEELAEDLPEGDEESVLQGYVRHKGLQFEASRHFVLCHDLPNSKEKRKKSRARERLDLLETVYRTFLLYFTARGADVEVPRSRLMVVLFNKEEDYKNYSQSLDPWLVGTAGFYDPIRNVSFFYEHSSDPLYKLLRESADRYNAMLGRRSDPRAKQFGRLYNLLVEIYREDLDLMVVSHEATHQLAANTGLFPRRVRVPSWAHEGLAAFFETPKQATWSGIGAVNDERIGWYRALAENDREHSNIDFIVGDQIFKYAATSASTLHAYGQAWALTHFLMEHRFEELIRYYQLLGELPPDLTLAPEMHNALFDRVFDAKDRDLLDQEWRKHMGGLVTTEQYVKELVKKQEAAKAKPRPRR